MMRREDAARIAQDATYPENRDTALVPADTLSVGDVLTYDRRFPRPISATDKRVLSVAPCKQPASRRDGSPGIALTLEGRATAMILRADHLVRILVIPDELSARQEAYERPDA